MEGTTTMAAEATKRRKISDDESKFKVVQESDVECAEKNFSKGAITKLSDKLKGEEERNKKLVYCWVSESVDAFNFKESWLEFDANDDDGCSCLSLSNIDPVMRNDAPSELLDLKDYTCCVWKSKIIMVGGSSRFKPDDMSDKVFMYDTVDEDWNILRMKIKRCHFPIVVSTDDKIFVFGGKPSIDDTDLVNERDHQKYIQVLTQRSSERWYEYFDSNTRLWNYFPEPVPEYFLKFHVLCFHAVCPNQHIILFWMPHSFIFSFNYNTWKWETYQDHMPVAPNPAWSTKCAVLEDFLFWNDQSKIYAHDLCGHITFSVCTLPDSKSLGAGALTHGYRHSFLVHIGKGRLCLFGKAHRSRIWYITFKVQIMQCFEAATIHVVTDRTGFLNTPNVTIGLAMEISS